MSFRNKLIVLLLSVGLYSCKSQPSKEKSESAESLTEGLSGKVVWREGNFMPSIDGSNKNKSVGVSREILIYELTKTNQAIKEAEFFKEIKTKLVKSITSAADGSFKVALKPGTYSVFTKEEGGLFANITDGENNIFPVSVESGKVTELTIVIDYQAAY